VKPKYLETAQLEFPSGAKRDSAKSAKLGMLQRKHIGYDIWSVGDDEPEELPVAGEEIKGLSCLLPRKSKKGKLYAGEYNFSLQIPSNAFATLAPTPIARTIVMAAQPVKPTPDPSATTSSSNARPVYKNPPRESHPTELLTHKFTPYGAADADAEEGPARATTPMEVDAEVLVPETPEPAAKSKKGGKKEKEKDKGDDKKSKGKKRKGEEGESPKKPKKAKTAS
jgi:hypothetical protein